MSHEEEGEDFFEDNSESLLEISTEAEMVNEYDEKNNILYTDNLSVEIVSCEVLEDTEIESQTTYQPQYFKSGNLPDADYLEEYVDYETIKKVCPELRNLWESDDYTIEEEKEIYERNLDVIDQYTTMEHPKTKYFFVKCRITNLSEKIHEASVALDTFISSDQSEYLAMHECAVYFDRAVYTTGEDREKSFFWYTFEQEEVLECVIGYEIKEEWNADEIYYLGVQTAQVDYWTLENTQVVPLIETRDVDE